MRLRPTVTSSLFVVSGIAIVLFSFVALRAFRYGMIDIDGEVFGAWIWTLSWGATPFVFIACTIAAFNSDQEKIHAVLWATVPALYFAGIYLSFDIWN